MLTIPITEFSTPASITGLVEGQYGAVAVEAEQCSNVGIDSRFLTLLNCSTRDQIEELNHMVDSFEERRKCCRLRYCFCLVHWCYRQLCYWNRRVCSLIGRTKIRKMSTFVKA